jgi:hypothetical protein
METTPTKAWEGVNKLAPMRMADLVRAGGGEAAAAPRQGGYVPPALRKAQQQQTAKKETGYSVVDSSTEYPELGAAAAAAAAAPKKAWGAKAPATVPPPALSANPFSALAEEASTTSKPAKKPAALNFKGAIEDRLRREEEERLTGMRPLDPMNPVGMSPEELEYYGWVVLELPPDDNEEARYAWYARYFAEKRRKAQGQQQEELTEEERLKREQEELIGYNAGQYTETIRQMRRRITGEEDASSVESPDTDSLFSDEEDEMAAAGAVATKKEDPGEYNAELYYDY